MEYQRLMTEEECSDWMDDVPNEVERVLERRESLLRSQVEDQKYMKQIRVERGSRD